MTRMTRKIWLGLGAVSVAGVASHDGGIPIALAQHAHGKPAAGAPAQSGPNARNGGAAASDRSLGAPQGGEAYLTDGGPRDTRIRIYRDIGLMRGHLLVGGELVEQGRWDDALPHFLHPSEELYGLMERYIKLHKVTPFDKQLKALAQAVKAKNMNAYRQAAKIVDERLTKALASFRKFMTAQPFSSFTARTAVEIAKVAQSEYEAAIENGMFAKPVEYQDSRGFIWHVEQLLRSHAADFEAIDKARFAELLEIIAQMKAAWPAAVPPDRPAMTPQHLAEKVAAFEAAAQRFH